MICVAFFSKFGQIVSPSTSLDYLLLDYFSYLVAQLVVRLHGRHEVVGSNPGLGVTFLAEKSPVLSGRLVIYFYLLWTNEAVFRFGRPRTE